MNSPEEIEDAWRMLELAQDASTDLLEYQPVWLATAPTQEYIHKLPCTETEQVSEHSSLVATDWYIYSNCSIRGDQDHSAPSLMTSIQSRKNRRKIDQSELPSEKSKPYKYHKHLKTTLDTREAALQIEIANLETRLRAKDSLLADLHINACKDFYRQISLCLESEKAKKNKRKVAAASTYYTLKRFFNPSPKEIEHIFDIDHKSLTDALKRVKDLAFRNPEQLGWLFKQERGETNLYRYASKENLPWKVVQKCCSYAKAKELDLREDSVVVSLLKRFGH